MELIVLDFSKCEYVMQMHDTLREGLGLPNLYGNNLDALWDCLTGMPYKEGEIVFRGTQSVPTDLRQYMADILAVFQRAYDKYGEPVFRVES